MAKAANRAAYQSEDVVVSVRPTAQIKIGATTYTARAPKYQVWWDVARMLEVHNAGLTAMVDLAEQAEGLPAAEQREFAEKIEAIPTFGALEEALIHGREDPDTGRIQGGFLRRCLKPADFKALVAEVDDDDADLDLPDLYDAAVALRRKFDKWFRERGEMMGLPLPEEEPATTTARRTQRKAG